MPMSGRSSLPSRGCVHQIRLRPRFMAAALGSCFRRRAVWMPSLQGDDEGPRALFDEWAQRFKGAAVKRNVVEGFPDDRFSDRTRLLAVTAENDDAGIVVFHRQPPIIFGPSYLSDALAALQLARWHTHRTRERALLEFLRLARVDEHRRAIHLVNIRHRLELDLGRTTECAPHRDAELISSDVRKAGGQEFFTKPF